MDGGYPLKAKHAPLGGFQGSYTFQPTSVIDGTTAHWGQQCYAAFTNDCFTGSTAGRLYVNGPLDTSRLNGDSSIHTCLAIEGWFGQLDACWGNLIMKAASSASQTRLPPNSTTQLTKNHTRRITSDIQFRASTTANIKPLPNGHFAFHRQGAYSGSLATYVKLPPFPADDGVDRNTWIPRTLTISSGDVPATTSRARVKFGYDEDYLCNENTAYACYAVEATVNETTPFLWAPELTSSDGVSCASGCDIEVPSIEGRIQRTQVEFINSGGTVVGTTVPSFELGTTPSTSPDILTSCPITSGTQGVAYTFTFTAAGTPTITWSYTGTIPTGLTLASDGTLSGTPTNSGTFTPDITATNGSGSDTLTACSLTIAASGSGVTVAPVIGGKPTFVGNVTIK